MCDLRLGCPRFAPVCPSLSHICVSPYPSLRHSCILYHGVAVRLLKPAVRRSASLVALQLYRFARWPGVKGVRRVSKGGFTMEFKFANDQAVSRRGFALGAAATAALAAAGLAAPALAEEAAPDTITGASQTVDPELQLTQDEMRALILDYLRGWPLKTDEAGETVYSYREMFAIATCYNNHPGLSQVEFVLDPKTMKLLGSCEKGTEKCEHIKYNPEVVLYWYHQIPEEEYAAGANDYFNSYGVQIKGTAKALSVDDEGAVEFASAYMETMRGAEAWGATSEEDKKATVEMLFQYNDWIEITPTEYVINSLNWRYNAEGSSRGEWYDPESPYYGKSVRQEYWM